MSLSYMGRELYVFTGQLAIYNDNDVGEILGRF